VSRTPTNKEIIIESFIAYFLLVALNKLEKRPIKLREEVAFFSFQDGLKYNNRFSLQI